MEVEWQIFHFRVRKRNHLIHTHTTPHYTTPHHTTPHHTHKQNLDFLADYYGVHLPLFMLEFDSH